MIELDLQCASTSELPDFDEFERWVTAAYRAAAQDSPAELTIRVVDTAEAQQLNQAYRQRDYATNVLSFPFEAPVEMPIQLLGDLVICAPVVEQEAREQNKDPLSHWAHMVVHGTLHLLGYDHINDADADTMEALETTVLATLGFADPYIDRTDETNRV
ncbi:rRNA maturation RNase YbeY [Pseudidiomarina aestuarii]|uniref:Endoribonuclease YbeY n=1 Tax=Pseudidiomarina aestuarii TaxID=624146 RepID=A0A7Z6ZU06_9GAMM|nr:rRNA maturation RNase YbeY [Pseudidiomarina aestuarii]RUO41384.1 rRNA maturation RNase YbeY [Pseudidiomarina aestuarii]